MGGWYQDVRTVRVSFKYEDLFFSSVPKENSNLSDRCSRETSTHELSRASRKRCVPDAGATKNIRSLHTRLKQKLLNSHSQLTRSWVEVPVWLYLPPLNTLMIGLTFVSSRQNHVILEHVSNTHLFVQIFYVAWYSVFKQLYSIYSKMKVT